MIPDIVILVPYRDRKSHYEIFHKKCRIITFLYITYQLDDRPFNRGAMKNIGFLMIKRMYLKIIKTLHWFLMTLIVSARIN